MTELEDLIDTRGDAVTIVAENGPHAVVAISTAVDCGDEESLVVEFKCFKSGEQIPIEGLLEEPIGSFEVILPPN